jgi:hypothetical protein
MILLAVLLAGFCCQGKRCYGAAARILQCAGSETLSGGRLGAMEGLSALSLFEGLAAHRGYLARRTFAEKPLDVAAGMPRADSEMVACESRTGAAGSHL